MSEPMSETRLAEIFGREQVATEGPWVAWDAGVGFHIGVGALGASGLPERLLPEGMRTDICRREDAEFIAHSRRDVGDLLAEVERLRAKMTTSLAFSASLYLGIQGVLDGALGMEEEDGAGEGIVADVALLVSQRDAARAELSSVREEANQALRAQADEATVLRRLFTKAQADAYDVREKLLQVRMVKVWVNEDGKRFVFADDVADAMGSEASAPITVKATGFGKTVIDATGETILNIKAGETRIHVDLGTEFAEPMGALLLDDPEHSDGGE